LWNAAAARIGKKSVKEVSYGERADDRNKKSSPRRGAYGIQTRAESFGDQNERHNDQTDYCANQEG
jgi:hypothetical protein